jgi:hypothetical protein
MLTRLGFSNFPLPFKVNTKPMRGYLMLNILISKKKKKKKMNKEKEKGEELSKTI